MIVPIIPTYNRRASLDRCIKSLSRIPETVAAPPIIVDAQQLDLMPGPARRLGAELAAPTMQDSDCYLFLDDDHELQPCFRKHIATLLCILLAPATGCIQLMTRPGTPLTSIKLGFTGGGILIQKQKYDAIGGYGDDYLDDVELFLRAHIAGLRNYRTGRVWSRHHGGTAGGLADRLGGRSVKRDAHIHLSRLEDRYPDYVERAENNWLGYRVKK